MSSSVLLKGKAAAAGPQTLQTDPGGEGETMSHEQTGKVQVDLAK